jgi:2-phosphosulfolactate phosphatase
MRPPLTVDIALAPALVPPAHPSDGAVYVVIDVIRATTTLCALFERGVRRVLIAPGIAEARTARERLGEGYLLAGEVGGARPPGFDLGNAPSELADVHLRDREIIFATTNGTRALHACRAGRAVSTGAFRDAAAVVRAALTAASKATIAPSPAPSANLTSEAHTTDSPPQIVFVCSGRGGRPAFDDTLCAGYLVTTLLEAARAAGRSVSLGESARIAHSAWSDVAQHGDLRAVLASSDAGRAIESIGLGADVAWCAVIDATTIVPTLTGSLAVGGQDLLVIEPL